MGRIRVSPEDLHQAASQLHQAAEEIGDIETHLNSTWRNLHHDGFEVEGSNHVAGLFSEWKQTARMLQSALGQSAIELERAAAAFEQADRPATSLLARLLTEIPQYLQKVLALPALRFLERMFLSLGALAGSTVAMVTLTWVQVPVDFKNHAARDGGSPLGRIESLDAKTVGNPQHIGTLGLHLGKARDYISSKDPGVSPQDQQRVRVPGREIRSYERGKIEWISYDDIDPAKYPERFKELTEVQHNPRGITLQVYYPESNYRVKYSHIVPSDRILEISGISQKELPSSLLKKSFKDIWVEPGEILGNYNQIGYSTTPHLHLDVREVTVVNGKEISTPIDPDDTAIPGKTLY